MEVVSSLRGHWPSADVPPCGRLPVAAPKTQSQVQKNTPQLQEEAEPLRGRRPTPLPARESRRGTPLPCLTQCVLANNTLELPLIQLQFTDIW